MWVDGVATLIILPLVSRLAQKLPEPVLYSIAVIAALAVVIALLAWMSSLTPVKLHYVGQGLFGFVSVAAILIAGFLYFMERRFTPKLEMTLKTEAVRLAPAGADQSELLLKLVLLLKNNGTRKVMVKCLSTGLSALRKDAWLARDRSSISDMAFDPFPEWIPYERDGKAVDRDNSRRCLERATDQGKNPLARPTFMWPRVALEPGETDDVYLEAAVRCDYSVVRVLAKVRINPEDDFGYETKTLIPIADLCAKVEDPGRTGSSATVGAG